MCLFRSLGITTNQCWALFTCRSSFHSFMREKSLHVSAGQLVNPSILSTALTVQNMVCYQKRWPGRSGSRYLLLLVTIGGWRQVSAIFTRCIRRWQPSIAVQARRASSVRSSESNVQITQLGGGHLGFVNSCFSFRRSFAKIARRVQPGSRTPRY